MLCQAGVAGKDERQRSLRSLEAPQHRAPYVTRNVGFSGADLRWYVLG